MWLTIVLERHLLPRSNLKISFNTLWLGFAFEQRECTTSWREFLWKNFYLAKISSRLELRSCRDCYQDLFPGRILAGILEKSFFLRGSRRVQSSWRGSWRDTRREFFLGRIPPGKQATSAGSWRDPGEHWESWWDPGEILVPILQG